MKEILSNAKTVRSKGMVVSPVEAAFDQVVEVIWCPQKDSEQTWLDLAGGVLQKQLQGQRKVARAAGDSGSKAA